MFSEVVKDGLKGSGDYGIVGFGIYNGQTANPELNDEPHVVLRACLPIKIKNQIIKLEFRLIQVNLPSPKNR